ncbi:MAG: hypothetical protein ABEH64_13115, partial [Salinirussus sp.]
DGTGTVAVTGGTWARLDAPVHPAPGEEFAGIAAAGGVLDGGLPHYERGGILGGPQAGGRVRIAGTRVGRFNGRSVEWDDINVRANGQSITGLALSPGREALGAKLVGRGMDLAVGETVSVTFS